MQQTTPPSSEAAQERQPPSPAALAYAAGARTLTRALSDVYADPVQTRRAFRRAADEDGPAVAADAVRVFPERFGAIREGLDGAGLRRVGDALSVLAALRESRPRQTLRRAAPRIRSMAAAYAHEGALYEAVQRSGRRHGKMQLAEEGREYARGTVERAADLVCEVYDDPASTARALWAYFREHGPSVTQRAIRDDPEHFGALQAEERTRMLGLVRERDVSAALARVPELAAAVYTAGEALRHRERAGDMLRLAGEARESEERLAALRAGTPVRGDEQLRRVAQLLAGMQWCSVHNADERKRIQTALCAMLPPHLARDVERAVKRAAEEEPRPRDEHAAERRPQRRRAELER